MRKALVVFLMCVVVLSLVAPAVSAEPKPTNVPHQLNPGDQGFTAAFGGATFADLWEELDGVGAELPQTGTGKDVPPSPLSALVVKPIEASLDDFVRGPVPIGFTFHYMNGPVEPAPGWPPAEWELGVAEFDGGVPPPLPEDWPVYLTDWGYTEVYVATNGFIVFRDASTPGHSKDLRVSANVFPTDAQQPGLGSWNWYPWQLPIAEPPNNFVAPYWTDWAIGDNSYQRVTRLCKLCRPCDGQVPAEASLLGDVALPLCCEVVPCERETVTRPRGRLLYATLGTAPNRKFVVEWLNARNHWTGFLATFELQLFEGSNAILFLYKEFQTKEQGQPYFDVPSVVIGMEDWFGTTGVGQAYVLDGPRPGWNESGKSGRGRSFTEPKWYWDVVMPLSGAGVNHAHPPVPMADGDMVGFVY